LRIVIAIVIAVVAAYSFASSALSLYEAEIKRNGRGYITDEIYYVSAARNILQKVFGAEPRFKGEYSVTVVYDSTKCAHKWYSICKALTNIATSLGISIRADYKELYAVYVKGQKVGVESFVEIAKSLCDVVDVVKGWMLPDSKGINEHINWEHPPLGKYLIALSMLALGDTPLYWRIPLIVSGILAALFTCLIVMEACNKWYVGLIAALLLALDPLSRALFSVALLDGYVAMFAAASLYSAIRGNYRGALLVTIVGGLFKATCLFTSIPLILLLAYGSACSARREVATFLGYLAKYTLVVAALYFSLLVLTSTPILMYIGMFNWFNAAVINTIQWHLKVKCIGVHCPVSSAPWDWFIGFNSFLLYMYPDGTALYARGFYPLWLVSLILLVLHMPLAREHYKGYGITSLFYVCTFAGYILIWVLGARTQYSFYAVHLAPLIYTNFALTAYLVAKYPGFTQGAIEKWRSIMARATRLASKVFKALCFKRLIIAKS